MGAHDQIVSSGNRSNVAIIWEGDDPSLVMNLTDSEVLNIFCRMDNAMLSHEGKKKCDTLLVIFAGFSADFIMDHVYYARYQFFITAKICFVITFHR